MILLPEIRTLTVLQPFASLIASGRKTVELRPWSTPYRGWILIGSGMRVLEGTDFPIGPRGRAHDHASRTPCPHHRHCAGFPWEACAVCENST